MFERRLGPLNSARIAHLDGLESGARGRPLTIEQIMEAIVTPALQVNKDPLGGGAVFLRLLGRAFSEPAGSVPCGRFAGTVAAGRAQARGAAAQDRRRFQPQGCLRPIHGFAILGAGK